MPAITLLLRLVAALAGIHGTVRVAGHGPAAAGVSIQVDGVDRGTTDSTGHYSVTSLTLGEHEFLFASSGYEPRRVTILLADSTDLTLDVELTRRPVVLPPIDVIVQRIAAATVENPVGSTTWHEAGHYRFTADWQANQPAGGVDLQQAIAMLPGVATRTDNATALSFRGGRGSENMVLLDGVPLIGAVHFAGAPSAINPDAVSQFDVHTGVSSARYDGALSGVIDLHTSDIAPRQLQLTGALSSTDVRSVARAPLGSTGGVLLGGRSSFRSLFTDASGLGSSTGYQDFIAAGHTALGSGSFSLVGFESGNHLTWESYVSDAAKPEAAMLKSLSIPTVTTPATPSDAANWQSGAIGGTWTKPLGTNRVWHAVGWWTGSTATISLIGLNQAEHLTSGISEFGLSTELRQQDRNSSRLIGAELTHPRTWYTVTTPATATDAGASAELRAQPTLGSLYGEWDWHGSALLDVRAGLRANTNFVSSINVDPRVTVNLRIDPVTRLEAGFGRTHQSVQSMLNEENVTSAIIGPTLPVAANPGDPVARADQWELSLEHQFGRSLTLSLDGYTRAWQNALTPTATTGTFFVPGAPRYGNGGASGITASIAAERGPFSLRASAGLATATQDAGGVTYHTGFEQPWSFTGDVNFRPTDRTTFQFRWTTAAGQARTAVTSGLGWQPTSGGGELEGTATNAPGAINALRLDGPMRLDLGARHLWPIGGTTGTRRSSLSTSVRLENLLNRADPIGIMEQPGGSLQLLRGTGRAVVFELGWVY